MNPKELSAELARLKQVAKSLMTAIEALQAKIDGPAGTATVPPPARPTTRIRRIGPPPKATPELPAIKHSEPPPRSEPSSARGAYRYVPSPSKKR